MTTKTQLLTTIKVKKKVYFVDEKYGLKLKKTFFYVIRDDTIIIFLP